MGTPIPWPVEDVPCPFCWSSGEPFYTFSHPKYIQITFMGIIKGEDWVPGIPEPPNGMFEFVQEEPCLWRLNLPEISGTYLLEAGATFLDLSIIGFVNAFNGAAGPCSLGIANTNPHWPGFWVQGAGFVAWLGGP